jgi:hypothetical protein
MKRSRPKIAGSIYEEMGKDTTYESDRVYARIETHETDKARTMRQAVDHFAEKFPKYGTILEGIIQEKRAVKQTHLYFGVNEGKRISQADYIGVMTDLGLSQNKAESFYPIAMEISRNLMKKRNDVPTILLDI